MISHNWMSPRALAKFCGLEFGRDVLGRILLNKFMTQVKFLYGRLKKGLPLLRQDEVKDTHASGLGEQEETFMRQTVDKGHKVMTASQVQIHQQVVNESSDGLDDLAALMGLKMNL